VVLVVAAIGAAVAWLLPGAAVEVRTAAVREAAAGTGASGTVLNASGYVTARRRATVSSKITGKLVDVRIEEGMAIREGDVVARLDDAQYRAALELSRSQLAAARRAVEETAARLELAELTVARARRLVAEHVGDQAGLDAAETEVRALVARAALEREQIAIAERQVALRETELTDTVVRAPFTGIVISKDAQPGEMVSPVSAGGGFTRTGVCTVVDMDSLEIEVDVNEAYIARVRPEQPVEAVLDAYPEWRIPGHVITTIPAADRQKATVRVRIAFQQLDPRILPDMGVSVAFQESAEASPETNARPRFYVPATALRHEGGQDVVFVVERDRVERRAGRAGATQGNEIEGQSGLRAGERVVVDGPATLAAGERVRVAQ